MRPSSSVSAAAMAMPGHAATRARLLNWSDLLGWADDDHAIALSVFRETCGDICGDDWRDICADSGSGSPQAFFENFFRPVLIGDGSEALFTGYFEPELSGSLRKSDRFRFPLYRMPEDTEDGSLRLSREELETTGILERRDLEIAWLKDPIERFFLQIQGAGRINLEEGGSIRVGFGGKNNHPYRSLGAELVRRGALEDHEVSANTIRQWLKDHPEHSEILLWHNPSYVFFRDVSDIPCEKGPLGTLNRSVTAGRTVAVDPDHVPLGAPVWVEKDGIAPLRRLMVAQDTGSAIKGAQRADIFFGTGAEAGKMAGRVRDVGRIVVLLPVRLALDFTNRA